MLRSRANEYNGDPRLAVMSRLSTFLFDLDGTLIDSTELIMSSFRHTMRTHRGQVPPDREWRSGFGTPLRPQLARYARDDEEVARMVDTYRAHNREHHDRMVEPFDGVRDVLAALQSRGVGMGIVTSKNRVGAVHGLRHCGLANFFDVLVTADDVVEHKPSPVPVTQAMNRLESTAQETVFIGDSPTDCLAGKAAGVSMAVALWGPFTRERLEPCQPDHWLAQPAEVLDLG